ncbi:MAG: TolC family protein [Planctomycetota bacterium]
MACLLLLVGCQTYEREPLDLGAFRDAWSARDLSGESLQEFSERLSELSVGAPEFDASDGLSLREGQLVALAYNPSLRIARARVGRAAAGAAQAGLWADPVLGLDVLRITDNVPDPWVIAPGLIFSLPVSGRLAAERDLAAAELRAAEGRAREAEWGVLRDVGAAWIQWSAASLRLRETQRFADSVDSLARTASELADLGEVAASEAALLRLEAAQRRNRAIRLEGEVQAREHGLRGLLGLGPSADVELLPTLEVADDVATIEPGMDAIERRNPGLERLRREHEVAEQALQLEIRRQTPDLSLGPVFESESGQARVGLSAGLPIPSFNLNRRAIAEARAQRDIAHATFESSFQLTVSRWAASEARAAALTRQADELVQTLQPLLERQVQDARAYMQLGEGSGTLVLLSSLSRSLEARLELLDARTQAALARTEAGFLVGPEVAQEPEQASSVGAGDPQ